MPRALAGCEPPLAGSLFQIVGVLGLEARAHCTAGTSDSPELDALVTLVATGQLHHERLEQDAVLRKMLEPDDEFVLIQFKYSRQIPLPKITPGELKQVLRRLADSAASAQALGRRVTGHVLITNREYALSSTTYVEDNLSRRNVDADLPDTLARFSNNCAHSPD